jgi:2,3-dihydroxy-p-cumate/2,3-dihydroxybenzoate 3,4-dioxygenase
MFDVRNVRYVRLGTRDVEVAATFATRILGLQEAGRIGSPGAGQSVYFRSDTRHHTLVYFEGDPGQQILGLEVADAAALKAAVRAPGVPGVAMRAGTRDECALRNVAAMLVMRDPSGNLIELVVPSRDTDAAFVPPRLTGMDGFAHVGLRTTDAARDEAFWTGVLGARVSDRIGTAPMLRFDTVHHRVALTAAKRPGIHHVAYQVGTIDDVMRAYFFLRDSGVRVLFGPGREPTSTAIFVYFEGPDGMAFEYATGAKQIAADATHRPRHFPFAHRSYCMWGGKPEIAEFNP